MINEILETRPQSLSDKWRRNQAIRSLYDQGRIVSTLAVDYNLTDRQIYRILVSTSPKVY